MVDARIDQKAFQKAMRKAPENLFTELRLAWRKHHQRFVNRMKRRRMSGRPGLKAQTGTLRRGLVVRTRGTTVNSLEVQSVFSGAHGFFAHVHETGMTIHAKNAKALSFPIRAGGASRSTNITEWVTVQSVTIPPRLGFSRMWTRMEPSLVGDTNKAIGKALAPEKVT